MCAAARETFEESGVLFAGPADDPDGIVDDASVYRDARAALANKSLSFARVPAPREAGAARGSASAVGELGDAEGGAHPPLRHLLLRRRAAGGPARRRRQHRDRPARSGAPRRRRSTSSPTGRTFLLPPTWTQLDSLNGRTVAEVLAVERKIVAVEPHLAADKEPATGRSSSSTATGTTRPATAARPTATPAVRRSHERVRHPSTPATSSPASRRCCCRGRPPTR